VRGLAGLAHRSSGGHRKIVAQQGNTSEQRVADDSRNAGICDETSAIARSGDTLCAHDDCPREGADLRAC
jgi:hypothetical protein